MRIEDVIGRWITEGREQTGMTQTQLGNRLGELLGKPWPRQAISAAEKGRRAFPAAELVAFAVALGCNVENLLEPPIDVQEVTLLDGPPLASNRLRAVAATNTDLADCVTSMQRLRQAWSELGNKFRVVDMKIGVAYQDLGSALRGRGIARKDGARDHDEPREDDER